jgi:hypothetical protein
MAKAVNVAVCVLHRPAERWRQHRCGRWTWQSDMVLSRNFSFWENQILEFRAEAYNVTNRFRPGIPRTNLSEATFGQIRTSDTPRILRFALKYIF